jgi:hypothetical protein
VTATPVPARPPELDHPVYWFVLLDRALDAGNLDAAARARRELERLGYSVNCGRRSMQRGGVARVHA